MILHCWNKPHLRRESGVWVAWFGRWRSDEFSIHRYMWSGWGETPQEAIEELHRRIGQQGAKMRFA